MDSQEMAKYMYKFEVDIVMLTCSMSLSNNLRPVGIGPLCFSRFMVVLRVSTGRTEQNSLTQTRFP